MEKKRFNEFGLSPEILKAVEKMGFEEASPIQSQAIPALLAGSDVVGQSQTGTGKTAAFAIPAIEKVDPTLGAPQVLVLCPTRELAVQVAEEVAKLAAFKRGVRELPIYGGQSYERQFRGLHAGAQIIIGTPGRVMDHLDRKTLKLDRLQMIILDEADRMLDMGFLEDIRTILSQTPETRQTVLFSATLPRPIVELIKTFTRDAVKIQIESQSLTVPKIEQVYYEVERRSKVEALCRIIDLHDIKFGIIFCATKMMVDELTEHLAARGYVVDKLHGDVSQQGRERVMAKFRKHALEFLVATDVAARGLDVDDIEVVFNYDLPNDSEDYVHRIGRTGRAGREGKAVTLVAGREIWKLQNIIRMTKSKIRRERVPSMEELEQKRTNLFLETLRETLEKGEYAKQDGLVDGLLEAGHTATDIASALMHLLNNQANGRGTAGGERETGNIAPASSAAPVRSFGEAEPPRNYPAYVPRNADAPRQARKRVDEEARAPRPPREADSSYPAERTARPKDRPRKPLPDEIGLVSHERGMVRLALNVGSEHEIQPGDVVGVILGTSKINKADIGAVHLEPTFTLVDVAEWRVQLVLQKLNGIRFKGRKLTARIAV